MACYPREDYDVAVVAFAEDGEGRFDVVYLREEDYFELIPDQVLGCGGGGEFFDCAYDSCIFVNMGAIYISLERR